jgi:hypothetical protein
MGNTCVELYMISVSYVYKKPIIIIEHRYRHKFEMCEKDGFTNFKFDYTWQHDSFTKLGYIKSASPKHVILKDHANYTIFHDVPPSSLLDPKRSNNVK